jgi:hypothetical protein
MYTHFEIKKTIEMHMRAWSISKFDIEKHGNNSYKIYLFISIEDYKNLSRIGFIKSLSIKAYKCRFVYSCELKKYWKIHQLKKKLIRSKKFMIGD